MFGPARAIEVPEPCFARRVLVPLSGWRAGLVRYGSSEVLEQVVEFGGEDPYLRLLSARSAIEIDDSQPLVVAADQDPQADVTPWRSACPRERPWRYRLLVSLRFEQGRVL